jgi:hypothetical protein
LRLHLVRTLSGLPVGFALVGAKADERLVLLDLERHGGRTAVGVAVRVVQRILALTAAIWHNDKPGRRPCGHWSHTTTATLESTI